MTVEQRSALKREIRVMARPETIYSFLTDPSKMVRWMGSQADLDARPGGIFRVVFNTRDTEEGKYIELTPNQRVVFTWGWEGSRTVPPGSSTVEINLRRDGDATVVTLEHRDLPEEARTKHFQGWELYLPRLATVASGRDPGPDPNKVPRDV